MSSSPTHVVVLAAGRGSRLGALGADTPKWLLEVGEATIADRHLAAVDLAEREAAGSVASVSVVTGHAAEAIERFLAVRGRSNVGLIHNPEFATLNNWYSVLLALEALEAGPDSSVAVLNSDLLAAADWISRFLLDSAATPLESLIAVDTERTLTDESMKVSV